MTTAKKLTSIERLRAAANRGRDDAVDSLAFSTGATGRHHHAENNMKDEPKKPVDTRPPLADRIKAALKAKKPKRTTVELAILPQRRPWKSLDGRMTLVCDLDDEHLVNILFLLKRRALTKRLQMMDQKYTTTRHAAMSRVLGAGYSMPGQNADVGTALHGAISRGDDPYDAVAKAMTAKAIESDYSDGTTWEDFTDVAFHCCRLEALRRGLTDAIELVMTERLRLKD